MNDYFTQINEIEGEIASLKITLKRTTDLTRAKEIEEEIKQLEKQLKDLKNDVKKRDFNNFRNKYKSKKKIEIPHDDDKVIDDFLGPTGPSGR